MSARRLPFWNLISGLFLVLASSGALAQPTPSGTTNCTTAGLLAELARTNYIFLECTATITVTNPIAIAGEVTIEAADFATLSGNNVSRIFNVQPGAMLTLINLTLTGGKGSRGGAINNQGILIATNCIFRGNNAPGPNGANGVDGENDYPNGTDGSNGQPGTSGLGGAIWSDGEVYLSRCTFSTNSATGGNGGNGGKGGNAINNGFNSGDGGHGGIGAPGRGGAIYNLNHLEIFECVFERNTALAGNGGTSGAGGTGGLTGKPGQGGQGGYASGAAIHNLFYVTIDSSTFSDNRVEAGDSANAAGQDQGDGNDALPGGEAWGGAIANLNTADLVNSTFSTNRVIGGNGGKGADGEVRGGRGGNGGHATGGSFYNNGEAGILNCTFAGGSAVGGTNGVGGTAPTPGANGTKGGNRGGNLARVGGTLALKNTIVARPTTGGNGFGAILDIGYNLSSDSTINLDSGTSLVSTGPGMGGLADNEGFGRTFALASHSLAIDAGDPGESPEVDQRGFPIFGGARDIGAYEFAASSIIVHVTDVDGNPVAGVQIVAGGVTNVTNGEGLFRFPLLPAGDYTVTPTHAIYTFDPPSETVTLGRAVDLVFTALRTFSVSGFVRDDVSGISGVTIDVGSQQAVTDTNGFYRVTSLDPGSYNVEPSAPGYAFVPSLQQINVQADTTNVNFTAVGLLSISGRIRTENGQGVPNAVVRAGNRTGISGPTGDYTITEVPRRQQTVTPALFGYSFTPPSFTLTPVTDENGIDFTAFPSFQVAGQVLNTSNSLGANAVTLTLRTNAPPGPPPPGSTSIILLTDTNGFFSFTNLRAGTYVLTPSKTGHGFSPATNLLTLGPDTTNLAYAMFPAFSMSGRVTVGGTALSNATIVLRTDGVEVARRTTSTIGAYSFDGFPTNTYVITPEVAGYQFTPASRTVALTGSTNNLDFTSSGVFSIGGQVTKDGLPLANVTVRAGGAVSVTSANGNYALTNLAPGTYTITADEPRYSFQPPSITTSVGPDRAGMNFHALEVYTVNGEVREGSLLLAGARVSANGVTNFTASNGRYTLARVPGGSNVVVSVSMAGYEFTPAQQTIVLDSIKNGVNFFARGLSAISGRVTDAITSNGVGSVTITVGGRYQTNTSPTGFYTLTNVGPGLLTVVPARTNRGFNPVSRQVNVLTNSVTNNVNFVAFRASKLFGRIVFDETTNGIPGVTLRAESTFGTNTVTTDNDGHYVFPELRNTFYRLIATSSGTGFDPQFYELDLIADTERNFVGFSGFSISGRVTDGSAGVAGLQLNVNTPEISSILTDANGNYTFTGLREGDYTVTPVGIGYDITPSGRQLSVGPTNATGVNFVAQGNLAITGRVLEGAAGMADIPVRLVSTNRPTLNRTNISTASGSFTFTNLVPGFYLVQPVRFDLFTPTNATVDPFNYPALDFRAQGGRLSIVRSNNFVRLTLRSIPSRAYAIQTSTNATGPWGTLTTQTTDTNGVLQFNYPVNPIAPRLLFRTSR